ncbi:endolytic transglycosylase MltG [Rugosibacter aromaticivorans]|nr:endolytic transglycosylase MltG [Rugosibacter aromaticivorans]
MRVLKLLLIFALLTAGIAWIALRPLPHSADSVAFSIPPGASLRRAAQVVESSGIDLPAWQFELLGRLLGRAAQIKAGSYEVAGQITARQLLDKLTRGDVSQGQLVLVEGLTFKAFRATLNATPDLAHDSVALSDAALLAHLGATEASPEGLFFPDTYLFDKGSSDLHLLARAYHAMQRQLAIAWETRDQKIPLKTPYELLTLASLVEKETGQASDRPQIAAVFMNRLRMGMPLQTDPAVIYGLGEHFDGNLRRIDLQTDTPWNTYTRRGLPPTPITTPGFATLNATAHPPVSDKVYFVAKGDGHSVFSRTLEAHNRAVAKYQRGQK